MNSQSVQSLESTLSSYFSSRIVYMVLSDFLISSLNLDFKDLQCLCHPNQMTNYCHHISIHNQIQF